MADPSDLSPSGREADQASRSWDLLLLLLPLGGLVYFVLPWISGEMRIGGDIDAFLLPVRAFYSESLARGVIPLWDPHLFCGFPIHAEGQTGVFHPVHLVLYRLLPVHWALHIEHLLMHALAFGGTVHLVRRMGAARISALFAGSAFSLSSFMLSHYVHLPLLAVFAHTPLLCHFAFALGRAPDWRTGRTPSVAVGLLLASQGLLGSPPAAYFSALAWGVFLAAGLSKNERRKTAGGLVLFAVMSAVLLAGIQWIPTIAFLPDTDRLDATESDLFSLHPWNLVQFVAPYAFEEGTIGDPAAENSRVEFSVYPGIGLLMLAAVAVTARRRSARGSPVSTAVMGGAAAAAFLLMMGRYGGLSTLLENVPLLGGFRCPVRHFAVFQFFLLLLAVSGIQRLIDDPPSRASLRRLALGLAVVGVVAHALVWPLAVVPEGAGLRALSLSAAQLLGLCALGCWVGHPRSTRRALSVFLLAAGAEVLVFGILAGPTHLPRREIRSIQEDLAGRETKDDLYRVVASWNREVLAGHRNAIGYAALEPRMPARFRLPEYSVRRIQEHGGAWREIVDPQPRIRIEAGSPFELRIIRDGDMEQTIETSCPDPHALVVADRYDEDWVCTVDGRRAPIEAHRSALRRVRLPAGRHTIQFSYRPRSFRVGSAVSMVGLVVFLVGFASGSSALRRAARPSPDPS